MSAVVPLPRREFADGLITALATATGRPVGDGVVPDGATVPYLVVHSIDGGSWLGAPFLGDETEAELVWQVDSVGERRDQAEWMADKVRETILGRANNATTWSTALTAPSGWKVNGRRSEAPPGPATPAGAPPDTIWSVAERFVLFCVYA